jgi:hypothetical protein
MRDVLLRLGGSEGTFARRSFSVHFLRVITNAYCIRAACSGARNFSKSPKKPTAAPGRYHPGRLHSMHSAKKRTVCDVCSGRKKGMPRVPYPYAHARQVL